MNYMGFHRSTPYCLTIPASSTGSLWTGYGGWHYQVCTFLLILRPDRHKSALRKSTQFIRPGIDYVTQRFRSSQIGSSIGATNLRESNHVVVA
ncbi:hypothetical protein [Spirosoma gilvum]